MVVASAATATACAYSSNLVIPPRPVTAEIRTVAAITATSSTIGIADSNLYGETQAQINQTLDTLQSIGVQNIRIFVPWAFVEPVQGVYNWTHVDEIVNAAAARNMGVLAEVNATPLWDATSGTLPGAGTPTPSYFASFMTQVATRYGNNISAYEIWNEPNSIQFSDPIDPAAYTALLQAAYPAIKAANPNATVIAAGLGSVISFGNVTLDPITYVQDMYKDGAQGFFDALAFHPYQESLQFSAGAGVPNSPLSQVQAIYALMQQYGDAAKQIWTTEYGLPTADVSQQTQADFIKNFINTWETLAYAGPQFIYTAQDSGTDANGTYGIYGQDWTPKLAVAVIQQAIAAAAAKSNPLAALGQQIAAALAQALSAAAPTLGQALANALAQALAQAAAAWAAANTTAATPAATPAVKSPVAAVATTAAVQTPAVTASTLAANTTKEKTQTPTTSTDNVKNTASSSSSSSSTPSTPSTASSSTASSSTASSSTASSSTASSSTPSSSTPSSSSKSTSSSSSSSSTSSTDPKAQTSDAGKTTPSTGSASTNGSSSSALSDNSKKN